MLMTPNAASNDRLARHASWLILLELLLLVLSQATVPVTAHTAATSMLTMASIGLVISLVFLYMGIRGVSSGVDFPVASWMLVVGNVLLVTLFTLEIYERVQS